MTTDTVPTPPWWLWGFGANAVGHHHATDKTRCTECGRTTRLPIELELDRALCGRCNTIRIRPAVRWLQNIQTPPGDRPE